MNNEQKEALYGPTARHAEHREGDEILVQRGIEVLHGKILHVRAAAPAPVSGKPLGLLYMVDMGTGIPEAVFPSQIKEGPFTAILGSYGAPTDGCTLSRRTAENIAVNVQGQVIDTEQGRLRVLSARIEGDEKAGQVIAECEAVRDGEDS